MILLPRILGRLLAGVLVLWATATATFLLLHFSNGDPVIAILGGPSALPSPEVIARVRHDYGLDLPLYQQYARHLGRLVRGDLGESYRLRVPVARAIGEQLGATLLLAVWAAGCAVILAVVLALFTAGRAEWIRSLAGGSELLASSTPVFLLGIVLLLVFSFALRWLPATGSHGWRSLVLPVAALAIPITAWISQVLRRELEKILEQPFILTARARGLSETGVRLGHALRHVLVLLLTLSGLIFGWLIGGAVIAETVFARQGIGRLLVDSTTSRDVPLVLGLTLFSTAGYVAVNLLVDLLAALCDPREAASNDSDS
jgi:peptide/nickel transport system permease protein